LHSQPLPGLDLGLEVSGRNLGLELSGIGHGHGPELPTGLEKLRTTVVSDLVVVLVSCALQM